MSAHPHTDTHYECRESQSHVHAGFLPGQSHPPDASHPLFETGVFVVTARARAFLAANGLSTIPLVERHTTGDWEELPNADRVENHSAVKFGGRVFSRYVVLDQPIWIITEADRSITTMLLPQEY